MTQAYELIIPIRDMSLYDACDRNYDHLLLTTDSVDHFEIRDVNRPDESLNGP